jgi:hypothetical protein
MSKWQVRKEERIFVKYKNETRELRKERERERESVKELKKKVLVRERL